MSDPRETDDGPSGHEQCWAELRTAMQQLETSMNYLQDATSDLEDAFAAADRSGQDRDNSPETGPATPVDSDPVTEDAASD